MTSRTTAALGLTALVLAAATGACGVPRGSGPAGGNDSGSGGGPITVLAAASLTEAFTQIGGDYQAKSGTAVRFSFGSSATLATQIVEGAPADVFAAASPASMQPVTNARATSGTSRIFATNALAIAVPIGNPGQVRGLHDFADERKAIAVCAPQVPCGAAAARAFASAGVAPRPDTEEPDVKAALAKVSAGEVDAALVYRTDVVAARGKVEGIEFPESASAGNDYLIAALKESRDPAAAAAFVDYVLSQEGQSVLARAGFAAP